MCIIITPRRLSRIITTDGLFGRSVIVFQKRSLIFLPKTLVIVKPQGEKTDIRINHVSISLFSLNCVISKYSYPKRDLLSQKYSFPFHLLASENVIAMFYSCFEIDSHICIIIYNPYSFPKSLFVFYYNRLIQGILLSIVDIVNE